MRRQGLRHTLLPLIHAAMDDAAAGPSLVAEDNPASMPLPCVPCECPGQRRARASTVVSAHQPRLWAELLQGLTADGSSLVDTLEDSNAVFAALVEALQGQVEPQDDRLPRCTPARCPICREAADQRGRGHVDRKESVQRGSLPPDLHRLAHPNETFFSNDSQLLDAFIGSELPVEPAPPNEHMFWETRSLVYRALGCPFLEDVIVERLNPQHGVSALFRQQREESLVSASPTLLTNDSKHCIVGMLFRRNRPLFDAGIGLIRQLLMSTEVCLAGPISVKMELPGGSIGGRDVVRDTAAFWDRNSRCLVVNRWGWAAVIDNAPSACFRPHTVILALYALGVPVI